MTHMLMCMAAPHCPCPMQDIDADGKEKRDGLVQKLDSLGTDWANAWAADMQTVCTLLLDAVRPSCSCRCHAWYASLWAHATDIGSPHLQAPLTCEPAPMQDKVCRIQALYNVCGGNVGFGPALLEYVENGAWTARQPVG